jgi:hypothetical protein
VYVYTIAIFNNTNPKKDKKMKQLIACCGIDCESCDAHIATVNNDNELREKTAEKWRVMYNASEITAESLHCMGCRIDGVKIGHYSDCGINKCVQEKGFNTCGDCKELATCQIVSPVLDYVPGARKNLAT